MNAPPLPARLLSAPAIAALEGARLLFAPTARRRMPLRVYTALGGRSGVLFPPGRRSLRRRFHDHEVGATFTADLSDWLEREHYFRGYPDPANLLLARQWLRPGDTWVDIGANRGVLALHAASIVGPAGCVLAFEPNPRTYGRLLRHLRLNPHRRNIRPFPLALGSRKATIPVAPRRGHHGRFNLRRNAPGGIPIPVDRADALIAPGDLRGRTLVKIDVEGLEWDVLQGMGWLLDRPRTSFSIEVSRSWLAERGAAPEELFALIAHHGYTPRRMGLRPAGRGRAALDLTPPRPGEEQADIWFARPGEEMELTLPPFPPPSGQA